MITMRFTMQSLHTCTMRAANGGAQEVGKLGSLAAGVNQTMRPGVGLIMVPSKHFDCDATSVTDSLCAL
jgi:hypothetical protein